MMGGKKAGCRAGKVGSVEIFKGKSSLVGKDGARKRVWIFGRVGAGMCLCRSCLAGLQRKGAGREKNFKP